MGIPLDSLRIPASNWEYSEVLRDALTCLAWGIDDLEDFWAMPPMKRALYTSAVAVKSQMRAYEEQLSADDLRRAQDNYKT